jgi:hypothetical protein
MILTTCLALLVNSGLQAAVSPVTPTAPPGFRLILSSISGTDSEGRAGPNRSNYRLTFLNQSRKNVTIGRTDFWAVYRVFLRSPKQIEVPLTSEGAAIRKRSVQDYLVRDGYRPIVLHPGESHFEELRLILPKLFKAGRGRYLLQMEYVEPEFSPMRICSNVLLVKI